MTVDDEIRARRASLAAEPGAAGLRPVLVARPDAPSGTGLILFPKAGALPSAWVGPVPAAGLEPDDAAALLAAARPCSLLPQHAEGWFGRPGLSGHRLGTGVGGPEAGGDWSPLFRPVRSEHDGSWARVEAADTTAALELVTETEAVPGGAIRARHTLTNTGRQPYIVDSLEVVFPLPGRVGEVLDFAGRQMAERIPQRHRIGDGLWLREGRRGHTGHDSATVLVAGVPGFTFGHGEAYGLHVSWSGNTVHRLERVPSGLGMTGGADQRLMPGVTTIGGGELLNYKRHKPWFNFPVTTELLPTNLSISAKDYVWPSHTLTLFLASCSPSPFERHTRASIPASLDPTVDVPSVLPS